MSVSVDTAYNSTQEICIARVLQLLIQSLLVKEVIFELRSELGESANQEIRGKGLVGREFS